jgi:predicted amidohydrolase
MSHSPTRVFAIAANVEETSIHATIDLTAIQHQRRSEPALLVRRPELYLDGAGA